MNAVRRVLNLQIAFSILQTVIDINIMKAEFSGEGFHHSVGAGNVFIGAHLHARVIPGHRSLTVYGVIGHHIDNRVRELLPDDFTDAAVICRQVREPVFPFRHPAARYRWQQ